MTDTSVKSTLPVPPAAAAAPQTAPAPQAQQAAKSTSPVPQAAGIGPSPLLIGKSFIKQYYQVLSSNPEHITKFYKPNSMISHSFQPSVPAEPKTLSSDQFFQWAQAQSEDESNDGLCFDFGKGAIDAQETIQGGILLVVTGRMKLAESASIFKTFVHTFFLNNGAPAGKKRQFYVHNDILRFISCAEENQNGAGEGDVTTTASTSISVPAATVPSVPATVPAAESDKKATTISPEATSANVDTVTEKEENVPASEPVVEHQQKEKLASVPQDKPSNGETPSAAEVDTKSKEEPAVAKETSKPEVPSKKKEKKDVKNATAVTSKGSNVGKSSDKSSKATQDKKKDASTAPASGPSSKDEKKSKKNKSRGRSRKSRSSSPTDKDDKKNSKSKPKTPGSWASLVAGGAAPTAKPSAAAVAAADAAQQITSAKESKAQESSVSEEADVAPTGDGDDATAADTSSSSANANTSNTKANPPAQAQAPKEKPPQRTPEATVLIKNIPDRTKEPEIRAMFQPYATKMNQKILGITLLANRGFCFVDFDSKNVVEEVVKDVAACKKDGKPNKFMINGKKLDVARKVPMDNKGGRGRGFRSASPGNGNFKHRGGRRPSPRGGNRSGAGKK
eukprot:CAMPEP_0194101170 /NCGR_PEP_ID=MMETSP0150-20130528/1885_1 /TAXON_ID=122233 /ORGANISM="Chaetoceros debilis, Strain MM31A-1" /LENGTH=620 /DNA_ID=CAMNT_0038787691 /DNA_START=476 /DNA_END=2338 /DNA_ORIENTATION=+